MTTKFVPHYLIRPIAGSDQVNLRIINPTDANDYVSLVRDGAEEACYEIMESYNSQIGDPNFFYDWNDTVVFYEDEELGRFDDEGSWDEDSWDDSEIDDEY